MRNMMVYVLFGIFALCILCASEIAAKPGAVVENSFFRYEIGADGNNLKFIDKKTGKDYVRAGAKTPCALLRKDRQEFPATKVSQAGDKITVDFANSEVSAVLRARNMLNHTILEVFSVSTESIDSLMFLNIPLSLEASASEKYAATAMALNLQTKINDLPGPTSLLQAECFPKFGLKGARAAILACPSDRMRAIMKVIVAAAPDLPHSNVGGPWAMDAVMNRESYMLDWEGMTEQNVDDWIKVAKKIGIKQFDFNAGTMMRYGDFEPNRKLYPKGYESLKNIIDKLHAAGLKAGLHTYSCFVAKDSKYVTPKPDPRLAKIETFTLAAPLTPDAKDITVSESTENVKTTVGFFAANSVTLQIDDELITYKGVSKTAPFTFTGCERGVHGTKPTSHSTSAKVHHLKEMFFLFAPDPDSTMLEEVALNHAKVYNLCGFDMIYLDAIDGMYVLADTNTWHYSSKFVFDISKNIKKAALIEMSDMLHHFWYVRSRMGAWDVAMRGQKSLVDAHAIYNRTHRRKFLPTQLGWWIVYPWQGVQPERTFPDEIEYLCSKALATDSGLSLWRTFTPEAFMKSANWDRISKIMSRYEELKLSGYFPESIKKKIAKTGKEFTLDKDRSGKWQFYPITYDRQKTAGTRQEIQVENAYQAQPLKLRIEAQKSAMPYEAAEGITLLDFSPAQTTGEVSAADGVTADIAADSAQVKAGDYNGRFTALSNKNTRVGSWAKFERTLTPVLDFKEPKALGLWVYGDGNGEIINVQLTCPPYVGTAHQHHYIKVDFTGWKYFVLVESENRAVAEYEWPKIPRAVEWDSVKSNVELQFVWPAYIMPLNYNNIDSISVWYNNLPENKKTQCLISPIKALPLVDCKIKNPTVSVGDKKLMFPVELESGSYIEFVSMDDCKVYNREGEIAAKIRPVGETPVLDKGQNNLVFTCEQVSDTPARTELTVITRSNRAVSK